MSNPTDKVLNLPPEATPPVVVIGLDELDQLRRQVRPYARRSLAEIKAELEYFEQIKSTVLNPERDIVYLGPDGRAVPYLMVRQNKLNVSEHIRFSGWVILSRFFGISVSVVSQPTRLAITDPGGSETYIWMTHLRGTDPDGRFVEMYGYAWSRDRFLTGGQKREAIEPHIAAKSYTVAFVRLCRAILGVAEPAWDELEQSISLTDDLLASLPDTLKAQVLDALRYVRPETRPETKPDETGTGKKDNGASGTPAVSGHTETPSLCELHQLRLGADTGLEGLTMGQAWLENRSELAAALNRTPPPAQAAGIQYYLNARSRHASPAQVQRMMTELVVPNQLHVSTALAKYVHELLRPELTQEQKSQLYKATPNAILEKHLDLVQVAIVANRLRAQLEANRSNPDTSDTAVKSDTAVSDTHEDPSHATDSLFSQ